MTFDWKEYLHLACFLRSQTGSGFGHEAVFRSAVSRVYYSAFCFARNFARDNHGFSPKKEARDHEDLKNHFKSKREIKISENLDRLRKWRNQCDYDDTVVDISKLLDDAISRAQLILDGIQSLSPP